MNICWVGVFAVSLMIIAAAVELYKVWVDSKKDKQDE